MKSPTHAIDGDYIREWLVLGPFHPSDLETDFLAAMGGEANIDPQEGDTVTTSEGLKLTWKRYQTKSNLINLSDALGYPPSATVYAACVLQSQTTGDAQISLGGGSLAVWINGHRVYSDLVSGDPIILNENLFEVKLKPGANCCLVKVSQHGVSRFGLAMRVRALPEIRAVISGIITDETGAILPNAVVRLEQTHPSPLPSLEGQGWVGEGSGVRVQTQTDASGHYRLNVYPVGGQYDLSAGCGEKGAWQLGICLREGERRALNLTLKEAISIEGALLMLDDATPHVAAVVQAVKIDNRQSSIVNSKVVATTLSDEHGRYRFINLKPGRYQVRCQTPSGDVYYRQVSHQAAGGEGDVMQVEDGKTLGGIDFHFPSFKKGIWQTYTPLDGLPDNNVHTIHGTPDGAIWFATESGVSCYDGERFRSFTQKDGLPNHRVSAIYSAPDGGVWFGTLCGVFRYDGKAFANLTNEIGLSDPRVSAK